jgi:hypothetical protein
MLFEAPMLGNHHCYSVVPIERKSIIHVKHLGKLKHNKVAEMDNLAIKQLFLITN